MNDHLYFSFNLYTHLKYSFNLSKYFIQNYLNYFIWIKLIKE